MVKRKQLQSTINNRAGRDCGDREAGSYNKLLTIPRRGYIALVSFLVISTVVLVIGITLALLGVSEAQMGLSEKRGHYAFSLAEGCAEDALLSAYYDGGYAGGVESYPEGSCNVSVVKDGNNWTIITAATASGHTKKIEVKINRGNEIIVTSWKEME